MSFCLVIVISLGIAWTVATYHVARIYVWLVARCVQWGTVACMLIVEELHFVTSNETIGKKLLGTRGSEAMLISA